MKGWGYGAYKFQLDELAYYIATDNLALIKS